MKTEKVHGSDLIIGDTICDRCDANDPNSIILVLKRIDELNGLFYCDRMFGDCSSLLQEKDGTYSFVINTTWDKIVPHTLIGDVKKTLKKLKFMDFIFGNLEFYPLAFALVFLYRVEIDWRFWVTIFSVAACAGISQSYINNKKQ